MQPLPRARKKAGPRIILLLLLNWNQEFFKEAFSTAPVLGYPDFFREFILETDASLKGPSAILSHQGKDRKISVIAYASYSLHPSERLMCNYSSAKLELLALMWAAMEKFQDYLLGSCFQVYTDNSPLTYVQESKLDALQSQWLSELAFFDFVSKYQTGCSNRAADAQVLCLLHDGQGHQAIERATALCQEQFYWNTMF